MEGKAFILGLALGMIGGAIIVANSNKARMLVTNGQQEVMRNLEEMTKDVSKELNEQKHGKS